MTEPNVFERPDFPTELYQQWRRAVDRVDRPSEDTGSWRSVLQVEPRRADLVRHPVHGEGQLVAKTGPATFICCFVNDAGTFDVKCKAVELEVFLYRRSRVERIRETSRLSARFFGRGAR